MRPCFSCFSCLSRFFILLSVFVYWHCGDSSPAPAETIVETPDENSENTPPPSEPVDFTDPDDGGSTQVGNPPFPAGPVGVTAELVQDNFLPASLPFSLSPAGWDQKMDFYVSRFSLNFNVPANEKGPWVLERKVGQNGSYVQIARLEALPETYTEYGAYGVTHFYRLSSSSASYEGEGGGRPFCRLNDGWFLVHPHHACAAFHDRWVLDDKNSYFASDIYVVHRRIDEKGRDHYYHLWMGDGITAKSVWAADVNNVFVAGWKTEAGGKRQPFLAVFQEKEALIFDVSSLASKPFRSIIGFSKDEVYAETEEGKALSFDGTSWKTIPSLPSFVDPWEVAEPPWNDSTLAGLVFTDILAIDEKNIFLAAGSEKQNLFKIDGLTGLVMPIASLPSKAQHGELKKINFGENIGEREARVVVINETNQWTISGSYLLRRNF